MTVVAATSAVEQTRDLADALSSLARPGDVVVLAGDLGAGKTAFVQGFGRGLGVADRITSPTFTLVHVYEGRLPVHHLDVYRLEQLSEALDLGLAEMLDEGGVVLIEWGEAILPVLPHEYLEVRLTFGPGDDDRSIAFRPVGPAWGRRSDALAGIVSPWTVGA
ncbi:MAG: tRNA (adenosine(37)-N6)-threonylcarbamoyltransferase complex ATPase subunit type 1 TsaE [Acidimicrobiales bacterium]